MPPRFAYWTIILNGQPSSFRAREPEELLPTFNRLKTQDPTAIMKWFSGGTLWDSPEQAAEHRRLEREQRYGAPRARTERPWDGRGPVRRPDRGPAVPPPIPPPPEASKARVLPRLPAAESPAGLLPYKKGSPPSEGTRKPAKPHRASGAKVKR